MSFILQAIEHAERDAWAYRNLRASVRSFASTMDAKLKKDENEGLRGMETREPYELLSLLKGQVTKLASELRFEVDDAERAQRIAHEAAGVANLAMAIAMACGGLK